MYSGHLPPGLSEADLSSEDADEEKQQKTHKASSSHFSQTQSHIQRVYRLNVITQKLVCSMMHLGMIVFLEFPWISGKYVDLL